MTISGSADLAFQSHEWKTKEFNKVFLKMKECREKFDDQQKKLREEATDQSSESGDILAQGRKKAAVVQKLKKHQGPITSSEDIEKLLSDFPGWESPPPRCSSQKKLKSILRLEVTYARDYIFGNLKKTENPLFKLNKLTARDMVENLRVLYGERGEQMTADMEDVRKALDSLTGTHEEVHGEKLFDDSESKDEFDYSKDCAIVFKLEEDLIMGIVEEVHPDELWVIPLEKVKAGDGDQPSVGQIWKYPDQLLLIAVKKEEVLPCQPSLELDRSLSHHTSSRQLVVFRVFNDDVLDLFCSQ